VGEEVRSFAGLLLAGISLQNTGPHAIQNLPGSERCVVNVTRFTSSYGLVAGGVCYRSASIDPFIWRDGQDALVAFGPTTALADRLPQEPRDIADDGAVAVGLA